MTIQLSVVDLSGIGPFDLWKAEMDRLHETFSVRRFPALASVALLESVSPVGVFVIARVSRKAVAS